MATFLDCRLQHVTVGHARSVFLQDQDRLLTLLHLAEFNSKLRGAFVHHSKVEGLTAFGAAIDQVRGKRAGSGWARRGFDGAFVVVFSLLLLASQLTCVLAFRLAGCQRVAYSGG